MGEALRSMIMLVWAVSAVSSDAHAQSNMVVISEVSKESEPTVIYGKSENINGEEDEFVVTQPKSAANPLGNPIVDDSLAANAVNEKTVPAMKVANPSVNKTVNEISPQNPTDSAETPKQMNSEIQNTLYESGGRVYDVQSYPENDINVITEPNLDKEVTNYPSY